MKISDKVILLWLAFDGLMSREQLNREHIQILFEYQEEIASYFETHLPDQHKIYGNAVVSELRDITDAIFKSPDHPKKNDLMVCLGKMVMVAGFIRQ